MPSHRHRLLLSLFVGVVSFPLGAAAEGIAPSHVTPSSVPPSHVAPSLPSPVVATRSSMTRSPTAGTVRIETTMTKSPGTRADGAPQTVTETRTTVTKQPAVDADGQKGRPTVIHYTKTVTRSGAGEDAKVSVIRRKRIDVGETQTSENAATHVASPVAHQGPSRPVAPEAAPPVDQHVQWLKERWAEGVSQLAPGEPLVGGHLVQRTDTPFRTVATKSTEMDPAQRQAAVEAGSELPPEVRSKVRFDTMKIYSVVQSPKGFAEGGVEAPTLSKENFLYVTIAGRSPSHDVTVLDAHGNTLAHGTASTDNFFGWTNDIPTATTLRKVRWDGKPPPAAR